MKRHALFIFFGILLLSQVAGVLKSCGGESAQADAPVITGCPQDAKCPAAQTHDQVIPAVTAMAERDQKIAEATAAAGATQAASYEATRDAVDAALGFVPTPTRALGRPLPREIIAGDTFQLIMRGIGGCSLNEVAAFNGIQNINVIVAGDTIFWPPECYVMNSTP